MNRRSFLELLSQSLAAGALIGPGAFDARGFAGRDAGSLAAIDRRARLARHDPLVRGFDPLAPLSVGNGGFAFTADATGLQTFPAEYREIPLATQAEWGWHAFSNPAGYRLRDATVDWDAGGRPVPYASAQQSPAGAWLRQNPHRLSLARIGCELRTAAGDVADSRRLTDVEQRLDLWNGTLHSRFRLEGRPVRVLTCAHPRRDLLAFRIEAEALDPAWLALRIAFPYASGVHTGDPADWARPARHRTTILRRERAGVTWRCSLDEMAYGVRAAWSEGCALRREAEHDFRVEPAPGTRRLELVVEFEPGHPGVSGGAGVPGDVAAAAAVEGAVGRASADGALPDVAAVLQDCEQHWHRFWSGGAVVDLSGSADPRAPELERRIVLSEYLTAIQCAGTLPPQETGETFDSWYGKFHLEMHWWHAAHFALWDRVALLERSLPWYRRILPAARETARWQGYAGARWPKMVGPDGRESPSTVGVFLVWQQPHPIYLAELVYRARPARAVLETYRDVVFESAGFMASYARRDRAGLLCHLGPPLIPAQEIHPPATTYDPTFELAYWAFGLETAQRWRERLGLARRADWDRVLRDLAPLPTRDGLYLNAASAPDTFTDARQRRDHPSLLAALGFLPGRGVDRETMRRTLRRVWTDWQWDTAWGWDFPLVAMTAARLGERELAIDALLLDTPKNRYLPNGHNHQGTALSIYLPGNGGLLSAVGLMAGGWDGGPDTPAPGFPAGGWTVHSERLRPAV